jgi:pyruvate dehydrogenase E1 component alpha subunit
VTISFFGDGASGEGVLYESLNFAALKKLPIIFVCENNLYSTHLPIRECRSVNNVFKIGLPLGVSCNKFDGNNVLKVYEAAQKAVAKCRSGGGPVFMEFLTYRLRGHVGANDNVQGIQTDIRPKEEIEKWKKKDPIKRFKKHLIKNKVFKEEQLDGMDKEIEVEIENAYSFAKNSPYPDAGELNDHVFKE